jgi:hypothetical protein
MTECVPSDSEEARFTDFDDVVATDGLGVLGIGITSKRLMTIKPGK